MTVFSIRSKKVDLHAISHVASKDPRLGHSVGLQCFLKRERDSRVIGIHSNMKFLQKKKQISNVYYMKHM